MFKDIVYINQIYNILPDKSYTIIIIDSHLKKMFCGLHVLGLHFVLR